MPGPFDRDVPSVVFGTFLLLIRRLMLFVHNDQADPVERRKNGGTRPDRYLDFALAYFPPLVVTLAAGEAAVHDGDLVAEATLEPFHHLGRQRNFGDKDDGLPVLFDAMLDRLQINFGFAARCDAVQKENPVASCIQRVDDPVIRVLLLVVQAKRFRRLEAASAIRIAEHLHLLDRNESLVRKPLDGGRRDLKRLKHLFKRKGEQFLHLENKLQHFPLPLRLGRKLRERRQRLVRIDGEVDRFEHFLLQLVLDALILLQNSFSQQRFDRFGAIREDAAELLGLSTSPFCAT